MMAVARPIMSPNPGRFASFACAPVFAAQWDRALTRLQAFVAQEP